MKIVLFIFAFLSFWFCLGQENPDGMERLYFHVNISNAETLRISEKKNHTVAIRSMASDKETKIYAAHTVYRFKKSYPNTKRELLKTVYTISTDMPELLGALQYNFPDKYTRIGQFFTTENAFYPNDYGTTSPVENLGAKHPAFDLDMIMAPEAWGITRGNKKVVVGISDSRIDSLDPDFKDRIREYIKYSNASKGLGCAHGSSVAGIAIARMDNGYGRPGICGGCDVITNDYGNFKDIEELAAAGAKVINTSWALCKMGGKYKENIQERIKEMYDDGIIIVAGAGNGKDCNRDGTKLGDSLYPASFERVLSISGVYTINRETTDQVFEHEGKNLTKQVRDRRAGYFYVADDGTLTPTEVEKGVQMNKAVDLVAPRENYLLGHDICGEKNIYGGASSNAAPVVTGIIGLMWSVNYCLSSYEVESVLKLSSEGIENLTGNEPYKGLMGAGRVNAYRAVKMSQEMKDPNATVYVKNRDFYRFEFTLSRVQNKIEIKNQTFREDATVDFKAKNQIVLKPGTHLKPNKNGFISLSIDPTITPQECEPTAPKNYTSYKEDN
ncbi:MAG: subtilisin family serine protease [Candidatus Paceibacteria bacterium]|jgi:subtilisin family serine protease